VIILVVDIAISSSGGGGGNRSGGSSSNVVINFSNQHNGLSGTCSACDNDILLASLDCLVNDDSSATDDGAAATCLVPRRRA
jgi:hypothetical protein